MNGIKMSNLLCFSSYNFAYYLSNVKYLYWVFDILWKSNKINFYSNACVFV